MTNANPNITGEGTLQPSAPQNPPAAPAAPAEDTTVTQPNMADANASIIAQLQAQNEALIQQNNLLNQQVINLVQSGGQLNNVPPQPTNTQTPQQPVQPSPTYPTQAQQLAAMGMQFEAQPSYMQPPASLSNAPDMTLESLAGEIGKDRPMH